MTTQIVPIFAEINTLEAEGKALAQEWKSITRGDKARFTKSTKSDGFDTRLGKLMQKLKAEGGERISSQRLKDCAAEQKLCGSLKTKQLAVTSSKPQRKALHH